MVSIFIKSKILFFLSLRETIPKMRMTLDQQVYAMLVIRLYIDIANLGFEKSLEKLLVRFKVLL